MYIACLVFGLFFSCLQNVALGVLEEIPELTPQTLRFPARPEEEGPPSE
jgi:hypothetical protein